MTLDEYIATLPERWPGGYVDIDKQYGPQCWDLVEDYAEQVLGVPKEPWAITLGPEQNAYEAWTVFDNHMQQYFTKVLGPQAKRGDILVYGPHPGGEEGHICICLYPVTHVLTQNSNPDGSPSHITDRAVTYLLGALRPKGGQMYEGRTAESWALQAKDAEAYKQAVIQSLAWNQDMHQSVTNVLPVINDLMYWKPLGVEFSKGFEVVTDTLYRKRPS